MDAFYASVEQRDNPSLKGKPVAVGHSLGRGVVAAASYEARQYGVRSAMPSARALKLCPNLVFVTPRFDVYKKVSQQMHRIFHEYTDIIEPISLDEAFLDVTHNKPNIPLAVTIAREIKQKIRDRLHLVASAGVSCNKFLAKIASDLRKPDGLCTIHPSQALNVVAALPVENFWGVGPVTARRMHELGIRTGGDLRNCSIEMLRHHFGKAGNIFHEFARGIDTRAVEPEWVRKSVGCERTMEIDITDERMLQETIEDLSLDLTMRIERASFIGNTLTLKMKHHDFTQHTKSMTCQEALIDKHTIMKYALQLTAETDAVLNPIRLVGLTVSNPQLERMNSSTTKNRNFDPRQLLIDFDRDY